MIACCARPSASRAFLIAQAETRGRLRPSDHHLSPYLGLARSACASADMRYALFRWRGLLVWECWPGQGAARALCIARMA
jgi:hypothetical protein